MDDAGERERIHEGAEVFGADGEKVGKIVDVRDDHIVVEKGFFFPTDYYVPKSAIVRGDDDNVYLNLTRDEALNQGWDEPPAGEAWGGGIHGMAATAAATTGIAETTGFGAIVEEGGADVVPDEFGEYREGDQPDERKR